MHGRVQCWAGNQLRCWVYLLEGFVFFDVIGYHISLVSSITAYFRYIMSNCVSVIPTSYMFSKILMKSAV